MKLTESEMLILYQGKVSLLIGDSCRRLNNLKDAFNRDQDHDKVDFEYLEQEARKQLEAIIRLKDIRNAL